MGFLGGGKEGEKGGVIITVGYPGGEKEGEKGGEIIIVGYLGGGEEKQGDEIAQWSRCFKLALEQIKLIRILSITF